MSKIAHLVDDDLGDDVRRWRRQIHQYPEMAFEEVKTAALVAESLRAFGYDVTTGIAKTGVVGVKRFGEGPSVALRADMDALPIIEQNGCAYASQHEGCMHACGHDGHTAMLLGAAKALAERTDLQGTLHLVFQPAEENEGGARAMIEDGLFERFPFEAIYGLHNMPGLPVGRFQVRAGAILASFDRFEIRIKGSGGHGAMPHLARDSILAASALNLQLNAIASKEVSPDEPAVVTVGHFEAAGSYNVIPEHVRLLGSCRSLSPETRAFLKRRVLECCEGISKSYRVDVDCNYEEGYPPTINHEKEAGFIETVLAELVGPDHVNTAFNAYMGSEDFAFYLEQKPGCYFLIGNGDSAAIHSPTYDFDDRAAPYGVAAWILIAERALGTAAG